MKSHKSLFSFWVKTIIVLLAVTLLFAYGNKSIAVALSELSSVETLSFK